MPKIKYLLQYLVKLTMLILLISITSCKTQKKSLKTFSSPPGNTIQVTNTNNVQQEEEPRMVTPDMLEDQRVHEFAKEKSNLLCSMNKLMRDFNNEPDKGKRTEISKEINQLKNEIAIFDEKIKSDFPEEDRQAEVDKLAQSMAKDC
ncbi:MAG: hypothetical protein R2750_10635 [Bacteroidales bacterium]